MGRDPEIREAQRRMAGAVGGTGSAIVFVGEAGIGKSALIDEIDRLGRDSMTVLRATGVEDEMGLTWSGLASLIRPLLRTADYAAIAPSRRQVLDASLFLSAEPDDRSSIDPYAVSLAVLDLVTHAAARRPLLVLIDDMHWVDPPSARAITYIGRRLDREFVALIATSRSGNIGTGVTRVALETPSIADAGAMLREFGVSSASVRSALIGAVGTNPLLLATAVAGLEPEVLRGTRPIPDPLPFPSDVMDGAQRRLAGLADQHRRALLGIAVLGRPSLGAAQQMVTALGASLTVLEEAELAGIIEIGDHITFSHPTLRTAAYQSGTAPDRRRIHALAADICSQSHIVRAMHLSAAAVGPDSEVADALSRACEELSHRGALAVAAEQFVRAAHLSTDQHLAAARQLRAAELFLDLGLLDDARPLLEALEHSTGDATNASAVWTRARLLHLEERDDEACDLLRQGAAELAAESPHDAARLLLESLAALVREGRLDQVVSVVDGLQTIRPRVQGRWAQRIDATSAAFALLASQDTADISAIEAMLGNEGAVAAAPFIAEVIAPVLAFAHRDEALGRLLDTIERALRAHAAVVPLVSVLAAQQLRFYGVRQTLSIAAGEEAIRLANDLGRPKLAMMAAFGLAVGAAVAGDAVAHKLAADVLTTSRYPHADVARRAGLSVLHFSAGRVDEAVAAWEELAVLHGFGNPLLTWEADYLEGLVLSGRHAEARSLLATLDEQLITLRLPGAFDRVRALLTDDDAVAVDLFARSITTFRAARNLLGEGRTELCWGEQLRRRRRKAEARGHLERAVELFRTVGLPGWANRAEAELVATGAVVDATLPVHALLSPRELHVARLVASGASNRDIGVDLFLSERTVESYLSTIFRKLQIKNRRELAARSLTDPALRPQVG